MNMLKSKLLSFFPSCSSEPFNNEKVVTMPNYSLQGEVFQKAAEQFPTPFHLYDEKGIADTARALNEAFSWDPGFKEYYAVKALPNPHILRILQREGCGVDCSSESELFLAKQCGFWGDDIMFSANAMPEHELQIASDLQALINLDDYTDIDTLIAQGNVPQSVCLRYNPGGQFSLDKNQIMGNPQESKYGFTKEQIIKGLNKLKAHGVHAFGIHAFLSSNMLNPDYYPALSGILFDFGKEISDTVSLRLDYINLSGGIGIPYQPDEKVVDIAMVGKGVLNEYKRVFGEPSKDNVHIKTELGRFMTGPYGFVVTRAMHEKDIYKHYIGVDASAVQLIRPAMYGAYHEISVVGKENDEKTHKYDITGCLCENNDKFAIDRMMPKIEKGDLLVIHDAGAHAFAMGYQYNGRLRTAEILYKADGTYEMIRRSETLDDYFATLNF